MPYDTSAAAVAAALLTEFSEIREDLSIKTYDLHRRLNIPNCTVAELGLRLRQLSEKTDYVVRGARSSWVIRPMGDCNEATFDRKLTDLVGKVVTVHGIPAKLVQFFQDAEGNYWAQLDPRYT